MSIAICHQCKCTSNIIDVRSILYEARACAQSHTQKHTERERESRTRIEWHPSQSYQPIHTNQNPRSSPLEQPHRYTIYCRIYGSTPCTHDASSHMLPRRSLFRVFSLTISHPPLIHCAQSVCVNVFCAHIQK